MRAFTVSSILNSIEENQLKNYTPQSKLPFSVNRNDDGCTPYFSSCRVMNSSKRRGARVAESGSLENCCPGNGTVGSIPTLSAKPNFLVPQALKVRSEDNSLS